MNRSHEPFQKQVVRFLKTQGSPRRAGSSCWELGQGTI